jgi:hypothetical protein
MKRFTILLMVLLACGCHGGNDVSGNGGNAPDQQQDAKEYPPATSAEELVENFKQAYASGNVAAIEQMIHWDGEIDQKGKETVLVIILSTGTAGDGTITKAELREPTEEDANPWALREPEVILHYETTSNDDTSSSRMSAWIVKQDEHYFFYYAGPPGNE